MSLDFGLQPISVLVAAGDRIRVAIAGADRDTFARIPVEGTPAVTIGRNRTAMSSITLPIVRRPHAKPVPHPTAAPAGPAPALALAPITSTTPSPATTVNDIFDRYVEVLGGRAAIEKISSRVSTGTFTVVERGFTRKLESYIQPPRFAMRIGAAVHGPGLRRRNGLGSRLQRPGSDDADRRPGRRPAPAGRSPS
jgi:hypothetical protein